MNNKIIFILILILGFLSWGSFFWQNRKRKKDLQKIAESNDFNFLTSSRFPKEYRKAKFNMFRGSLFFRARNILNKDFGDYQLSIFDDNIWGRGETVFIFNSKDTVFPCFDLYHNDFNNKYNIPIFNSKRISYPQYPHFSKKYVLNGKDESAIRSFFNDSLLEYLSENGGFAIEGRGNKLLMCIQKYLAPPDKILENIEVFKKVYKPFWDAACENNNLRNV